MGKIAKYFGFPTTSFDDPHAAFKFTLNALNATRIHLAHPDTPVYAATLARNPLPEWDDEVAA